jgi:hypothetical protein
LRTYRKIKTDFKREQYLYADVDKKSLTNFIKIRVSNCNLNIEKGRYLKLPLEQRICQLCHTDVEDEFHFLMNCDKLIQERVTLFRNISDIVPSFTTMSDVEKFMFLLTGSFSENLYNSDGKDCNCVSLILHKNNKFKLK